MLPYASQNLEWNRRARLHTCIPLQMLVTFVLVSLLAFFSVPVPPFALMVV